ncbi:hypothetical protein JIN84_10335 [Luteolibacter yonseiensis]|uniref:SMODS and SLOG-associating 2TM effector domain-containing protein n=1 Tax=Luteolibacter yonseiensis TaxID=1144680 RepID=A0A934R2W0_9BACT|nr:hypothetical protein [Luteolibacter yonseiensis]MBK1816011.1 hypothetical protein [Luteolibacter yonseiensis]
MKASDPTLFRRAWFIGFAGHRQVDDAATLKAVIRKELDDFSASLNGDVVGLASAAAGADLLFLEACEEAGLRTVVILPFAEERFSADFDDPSEWRKAQARMAAATWCEVAPGNEDAPEAYHVVAREVLEVADRMLFAWNGLPARGRGGTAETVAEAEKWGVPSRIINTATLEVRWQAGSAPEAVEDVHFHDLPAGRTVAEVFEKLDHRAVSRAPRSRWFAAGSMSVNHLATFLQAVLVVFFLSAGKDIGAAVKFLMAMVAAALPWVGTRLRIQEGWVEDRVRAELLRSLMASHEPGSPLRPPGLELFEKDAPFIRSAALRLVSERKGWQAARDAYLKERIDDQIGFFKSKGGQASRKMRVFGKVFWFASWGAVVFTGATVLTNLMVLGKMWKVPPQWDTWGMEFIPSVLPGIAAWSMAIISIFEFKRRAGLYRQLVGTLQQIRPKLAEARCASAVQVIIRQCERLLLNELWEWQGQRRKK